MKSNRSENKAADKPGPVIRPAVGESIMEAVGKAKPHTTIKITSELYNEPLVIKQADLTLEPLEEGGDVTITQATNPCLIVDVGDGNVCTINNMKMLLQGPNKDADIHSF